MKTILESPELVNLLLTVIGFALTTVFAVVSKKYLNITEEDRSLIKIAKVAGQAVSAGVDKTYQEFVRDIKEKSADGKLTAEEKKLALQNALNFAKQYGMERGVNLIKEHGDDLLKAMIEDYITKRKSVSAISNPPDVSPVHPVLPSVEDIKKKQILTSDIPLQ